MNSYRFEDLCLKIWIKSGTTKVQPRAESADGAVSAESKSGVFLRKLKKPGKTAETVSARSPPFGTRQKSKPST